MDYEQLEHELSLLNGKEVSVVRPYGEQSDSFAGSLVMHTEDYPTVFEFQSPFIAIRFKATDVAKILVTPKRNVVYLKGIADYRGECVPN